MTDGTNTSTWEYKPYGEVYSSTINGGLTTDRLYTGHGWDDQSALYFAPYRYYNPNTARWMKRDPLGMVDGPNMYGYVGGNPVVRVDPLGLFNLKRFLCIMFCKAAETAFYSAARLVCGILKDACEVAKEYEPDSCNLRTIILCVVADVYCASIDEAADEAFKLCAKGCRKNNP